MTIHDYRFLLAERTALNKLISKTSERNIIGRMSLESRLEQVEAELAEYDEGISPRLVEAYLTFKGKPVVGRHGILADFGPIAVGAFADAVRKVGISQSVAMHPGVAKSKRPNYEMLITGTTPGSFGFRLEDASQQPALIGVPTPIEVAIEQVKTIMEATTGSDEWLAHAISEVDQSALKAMHEFLKKVADNDAVCALEFQDDVFQFRDTDQVRRSADRLSETVTEDEVFLEGHFIGYLPEQRRAEFRVSESEAEFPGDVAGTVIAGTVKQDKDKPLDINESLNVEVTIEVRCRRVGSAKPRYTIFDVQLPDDM